MLNKAERFGVLKLYRICCIVGQLPIDVDLKNWQLEEPSKRKRWICYLSYVLFVLHTFYKNGSLAHAYLFDPNVQVHQLVIHAVLAMASAACVLYYVMVYICEPALFAKYAEMTLLGNVGGPLYQEAEFKEHRKTRLWEYSMQDLVAASLPYIFVMCIPMIIATYIYEPSMRLLLYAALPSGLQSWASFGLLLLEEVHFLLVLVSIQIPIWQMQVISYDLVSTQIQLLMHKIQNGRRRERNVYRLLQSLQLYICILNNVNMYLVFICKLVCISIGIITGYAAVAHFGEHPIFGILYYLLLLDALFVYAVIYEKAFQIPRLLDQTAAYALLHLRGRKRGAFRRQILAILATGIKVGIFHALERASTPLFMDFVSRNIVNMLVAYG